jgi:hypothetical protein
LTINGYSAILFTCELLFWIFWLSLPSLDGPGLVRLKVTFSKIEPGIERLTGLSIAQVRDMGVTELRAYLEKKNGTKQRIVSEYPVIGRGNILRDGLISTEKLNEDVDLILEQAGV